MHKHFTRVMDLVHLTKELLEKERNREDALLSGDDVDILLSEEYQEEQVREDIMGYPTRPLYRQLGCMMELWMTTGECPCLKLPNYDLLDEKHYKEIRASTIASVTPLLEGLQALWDDWSPDERLYRLREIYLILGKRGLLDLLGVRKTVGTLEHWPPARNILKETFQTMHSDKAELTVGARALAKHSHRDHSESWWGFCKGNEREKNEHALGIMNKIMDKATWINIHQIVHGVEIVEVRQEQRYGVRWTLDGASFRGFLEPQMVGGHEVGWKH